MAPAFFDLPFDYVSEFLTMSSIGREVHQFFAKIVPTFWLEFCEKLGVTFHNIFNYLMNVLPLSSWFSKLLRPLDILRSRSFSVSTSTSRCIYRTTQFTCRKGSTDPALHPRFTIRSFRGLRYHCLRD